MFGRKYSKERENRVRSLASGETGKKIWLCPEPSHAVNNDKHAMTYRDVGLGEL